MIRWRFRTWVDSRGKREVQDDVDRYDVYGREAFSRALAHLAVTPKVQWHEPQAKKLRNEDPLYEIRYKARRRVEQVREGTASTVPLEVDGEYFSPDDEEC